MTEWFGHGVGVSHSHMMARPATAPVPRSMMTASRCPDEKAAVQDYYIYYYIYILPKKK